MKQGTKSLVLAAMITSLWGCGESDRIVDEIVEEADTDHLAYVTYLSLVDESITLFAKSHVFRRDVFNNDFKVGELHSSDYRLHTMHRWLDNFPDTTFAIEDTNTKSNKGRIEYKVRPDHRYWTVAWEFANRLQVSVFPKLTAREAGAYRIRVFTDTERDVWDLSRSRRLFTTTAGEVSASATLGQCNDLQIDGVGINLCQTVTPGRAYLVAYAESGNLVVIEEK